MNTNGIGFFAVPAQSFPRQFILSDRSDVLPLDWNIYRLKNWHLAIHPRNGLPVAPIVDDQKSELGWLIGHAVQDGSAEFVQRLAIPFNSDFEAFEDRLYQLSGRFAAFVLCGDGGRFYLDPAGSLGAVYCAVLHIVASSTGLIAEHESTPVNETLVSALDIPNQDKWYPLGLTQRKNVFRLFPNHTLDVRSWTAIRHWPRPGMWSSKAVDVADLVCRIASRIKNTIGAAVDIGPTMMNLTSGRDTRMLLACSRSVCDRIVFNTTRHRDETGERDVAIARTIARRFRLRHQVDEWIEASEDDLEEWLVRTGYCVAGRTWRGVKTREHSIPGSISLAGLVGEVGRCFWWKRSDLDTKELLGSAELLERTNLPKFDSFLDHCDQWNGALPFRDRHLQLDLFYLEQRVGCSGMPALYGSIAPCVIWYPFNHREVIDSMLRIPIRYRFAQQLADDLINREWPQLLEYPYNQWIGFRGWMWKTRRFSRRARRRFFNLLNAVRSRLGAGR